MEPAKVRYLPRTKSAFHPVVPSNVTHLGPLRLAHADGAWWVTEFSWFHWFQLFSVDGQGWLWVVDSDDICKRLLVKLSSNASATLQRLVGLPQPEAL